MLATNCDLCRLAILINPALSSTGSPSALPFSASRSRIDIFLPIGRCGFRRRIRKIPTLNDDWVMRLSDDGMSSSGKRGEGRLDWSGFSRAHCFADGLLLFQGPHLLHWFPDSACTQPTLPSEVGDLVRRLQLSMSGGALHPTGHRRRVARWRRRVAEPPDDGGPRRGVASNHRPAQGPPAALVS